MKFQKKKRYQPHYRPRKINKKKKLEIRYFFLTFAYGLFLNQNSMQSVQTKTQNNQFYIFLIHELPKKGKEYTGRNLQKKKVVKKIMQEKNNINKAIDQEKTSFKKKKKIEKYYFYL